MHDFGKARNFRLTWRLGFRYNSVHYGGIAKW